MRRSLLVARPQLIRAWPGASVPLGMGASMCACVPFDCMRTGGRRRRIAARRFTSLLFSLEEEPRQTLLLRKRRIVCEAVGSSSAHSDPPQ